MTCYTHHTDNEAGLREIAAQLLLRNETWAKRGYSIDEMLKIYRPELLAYADEAEYSLQSCNSPQIKLRSFDTISGHTEIIQLDLDQHFDASVIELDDEE